MSELIDDLIKKNEEGLFKEDREPTVRRLKHSCGHSANKTVWGSYRLEDRFAFAASNKCAACMQYDCWRHIGSLPARVNAVIPKRKWFLFDVLNRIIESNDIQGDYRVRIHRSM